MLFRSLTVLTEILAEFNIPFVETDLLPDDVLRADEAWVTTTSYCIAPVTKFNGVAIHSGPLWRRILDRWSEIAGKDLYRDVTLSAGSVAPR